MKKLSLFLLMGMLFALNSCEDSIDSLEESKLSEDNKEVITFTDPNGEVFTKAIPSELIKSREVAQSRAEPPCYMTVTYTGDGIGDGDGDGYNEPDWVGVDIDGTGRMVFDGVSVVEGCPCTSVNQVAYVWLVTSGGGVSIDYDVMVNVGPGGTTSGTLPLANGMTYTYY